MLGPFLLNERWDEICWHSLQVLQEVNWIYLSGLDDFLVGLLYLLTPKFGLVSKSHETNEFIHVKYRVLVMVNFGHKSFDFILGNFDTHRLKAIIELFD